MYSYSLSEIKPYNEGRTVNFETTEILHMISLFRHLQERFKNETDAEILRKLEFLIFSEWFILKARLNSGFFLLYLSI